MKKKTIKKLIFVFLIIILILTIILLLLTKQKKPVLVTNADDAITCGITIQEEVKKYYVDKITPSGISKLYGNYNGDNDLNDFYRKLYVLVNYLPEVSEVAYKDSTEISNYYNSHKTTIKNNLGLSKEKHFAKFCEYLKETGYRGEKYEESEIQYETYKYDDQYNTFDLTFKFENFDNNFRLKVHFANKSYTDPIVFYSLVKDPVLSENDIVLPENTVN